MQREKGGGPTVTVLIRTILVYLLLILFLKLMGKRQVGELEVSELVSALLLSEIAAMPVEDPDIPLAYAAIPLLTIISAEILLSYAVTKSNLLKRFINGKPSILIRRGVLDRKELERSRLSAEELMSELRLKGAPLLDEIDYAILEPNGEISVTLRRENAPVTLSDIGRRGTECGISHAVIVDGHLKPTALRDAGKDDTWLQGYLREKKLTLSRVFLLTVNDAGETGLIVKGENEK